MSDDPDTSSFVSAWLAYFATGALVGLVVFAGTTLLAPAGGFLLDLQGNGADAFDAFACAWTMGQLAVTVHIVLPTIARG